MMMSPQTEILCSFALTFGVPLAIAAREYWSLSISPRHLPPSEPIEPEPQPLPDAGVKPAPWANKRLPDCLIPQLRELV
jgi:hypothetical protein